VVRALLHAGLLEWLILAELSALGIRLLQSEDRAAAAPYLWGIGGCLSLLVVSVCIYRRFFEGRRWPRLVYNVALLFACLTPFAWLRQIIPIIHPGEVDAQLRALDLALFGGDASVWLERFATPFTGEWFSTVYFGYYVVGSGVVLYLLLFHRRIDDLMEFALTILGTNFLAFVMFTLWPAFGPYHHLAGEFAGPLPGEIMTPFVRDFVLQNGPLRDVFPSMHTALPLGIFLFAARHYRLLAIGTGLWAPHIIASTLFLRYHYLVDVVVGAVLVMIFFLLSRPALRAYQGLRRRRGVCAEG
jgi:membrane-associated phospholipid phosphatase